MYFTVYDTNNCAINPKGSPISKYNKELSKEEYEYAIHMISIGKTLASDEYGNMIFKEPEIVHKTDDVRMYERARIHERTDSDYLKYSRNIRLNEDVVYSQQCCDYIDQYNDAVSKTVNQPNYPAEVTYPTYQLPTRT